MSHSAIPVRQPSKNKGNIQSVAAPNRYAIRARAQQVPVSQSAIARDSGRLAIRAVSRALLARGFLPSAPAPGRSHQLAAFPGDSIPIGNSSSVGLAVKALPGGAQECCRRQKRCWHFASFCGKAVYRSLSGRSRHAEFMSTRPSILRQWLESTCASFEGMPALSFHSLVLMKGVIQRRDDCRKAQRQCRPSGYSAARR
jgi:hypothetical protein